MRKIASIRRIDSVSPIPDADRIEVATVTGWKTVIKRGEFRAGDLIVYLEVDAWVPHELAPWLSKGKEPREYQGVIGERLTTAILRGQISQGLALPLSVLEDKEVPMEEGTDVSTALGIVKWERAVPEDAKALILGHTPTLIQKPSLERVQNIPGEVLSKYNVVPMSITEKVEGQSLIFYQLDGHFGVCTQEVEYVESMDNPRWQWAIENKIKGKLNEYLGDGFALQGEFIGPGIQGNYYGLTRYHFLLFDIYDIRKGEYLDPDHCRIQAITMGLDMVPIAEPFQGKMTVEDVLAYADGYSQVPTLVARYGEKPVKKAREGVVFSARQGARFTFKAVSNKYLLKHQ